MKIIIVYIMFAALGAMVCAIVNWIRNTRSMEWPDYDRFNAAVVAANAIVIFMGALFTLS